MIRLHFALILSIFRINRWQVSVTFLYQFICGFLAVNQCTANKLGGVSHVDFTLATSSYHIVDTSIRLLETIMK
jgi:hypothetical protein